MEMLRTTTLFEFLDIIYFKFSNFKIYILYKLNINKINNFINNWINIKI